MLSNLQFFKNFNFKELDHVEDFAVCLGHHVVWWKTQRMLPETAWVQNFFHRFRMFYYELNIISNCKPTKKRKKLTFTINHFIIQYKFASNNKGGVIGFAGLL